jgi:hypothetical protein
MLSYFMVSGLPALGFVPNAPATAQPVCILVTPTLSSGNPYPFSFQYILRPSFPSRLNGNPPILFRFIFLRTMFPPTGGYTPSLSLSRPPLASIPSISCHPSHFSSTTYKMLLPQLFCFHNHPFSWGGVYPPFTQSPPERAKGLLPPKPESFDPAGQIFFFHQSRVTSHQLVPSAVEGSRSHGFSPPVPLRRRGRGATMFLNVVFTPHRETSPLVPVSKSMSRADAGCGSAILPIPGQRSCHQAGRPGSRPAGCGSLRAGKAGSVRLGQHALLEP